MKISELFVRQGSVEVEGTITQINEPRTFNKFGKELRVTDATLEDETGKIKLTLWNDDIDKFKVGDKIRVSNGYVNEFQGEKQLTSGKFGKMEKIGKGEKAEDADEEKSEKKDAEKADAKDAEKPEDVEELLEEEEDF